MNIKLEPVNQRFTANRAAKPPAKSEAVNDREVEFWTNKSDILEKTIDQAVYKLYDLTPDEIKLVEGS